MNKVKQSMVDPDIPPGGNWAYCHKCCNLDVKGFQDARN